MVDRRRQELTEQSKKLRQKKQKKQRQSNIFRSIRRAIGAILLVFVLLTLLSRLYISGVEVKGAKNLQIDSSFQQAADAYFGSLIHRWRPGLSVEDLQKEMIVDKPQISRIEVSMPIWTNTLQITVYQRTAAIRWLDTSRDRYYLVDDQGIAFSHVGSLSEGKLQLVKDSQGQEVNLGEQIIAPSTIDYLNTLTSSLDKEDLKVDSFDIGHSAKNIEVHLKNKPYYIKVTPEREEKA